MNRSCAVMFACLLSLTTACSRIPTPVVQVEYRNVYLPDKFLQPCVDVTPKRGGTWGDRYELAERRATVIQDCNDQLAEGRKWQADRRAEDAKKGL